MKEMRTSKPNVAEGIGIDNLTERYDKMAQKLRREEIESAKQQGRKTHEHEYAPY